RLHSRITPAAITALRTVSGDREIREAALEQFGDALVTDFAAIRPQLEAFLDDWGSADAGDDEEGDASPKRGIPEKRRKKLLDGATWQRDEQLAVAAEALRELFGDELFTGDAGSGESNIRRWLFENDWVEAIVALPLNLFYNTGIATYVWLLSNRKAPKRQGKVQLIDASRWSQPLRKNLGKKNCELSTEDIDRVMKTFLEFRETPESRIFQNEAFGY
ncbi:MAG: class I SAM-dependent DNA methyltransferase, partial [Pirellulaceae bacterium]